MATGKKELLASVQKVARSPSARALRDAAGQREFFWSGRISHPDDLRTCVLTGLPVHCEL